MLYHFTLVSIAYYQGYGKNKKNNTDLTYSMPWYKLHDQVI